MLTNAIQESGYASQVADRVHQLQGPGTAPLAVTLPGFHLLTVSGSPAPYAWLTPKPRGDADDLVGLWEAYVDNPAARRARHTTLLTPVLKDRAVLSSYSARSYFGESTAGDGKWAVTAVKLIAMAQHFEGQGELSVELSPARLFQNSRIERATLRLGNYLLSVGPNGMWSNTERRNLNHGVRGNDFTINDLCIRPLLTRHPLACALAECEEMPEPARHALNVALRGVQMGRLAVSDIRVGAAASRRNTVDLQVEDALGVLERGGPGVLKSLYAALVPGAVSARDFAVQFGNPYKGYTVCREDTIKRWRGQVTALRP